MPATEGRGMGNGGETGILVLFHLRTAARNGGKIAPVNYIITAASRERTGIQVAIVFVGMLLERQSSRPPPLTGSCTSIFLTNLSRVSAPTFNVCSLHFCGGRGRPGDKGAKERKGAKRGFSRTKKGPGKNYHYVNNNSYHGILPLLVTVRTILLRSPLRGCSH